MDKLWYKICNKRKYNIYMDESKNNWKKPVELHYVQEKQL